MKLLSLLVLVLALTNLAQSKFCQADSELKFDMLDDKGFEEYTKNGVLNLNRHTIELYLYADLPQPKQNALIRFKLQAKNDNSFSLFVPQFSDNVSKDAKETYFNLYFPPGAQEFVLQFTYGDQYLSLSDEIDEKIFEESQWFAVYFEKQYASIYYGKKLLRLIKLEHSEENYLNMFSLFNSESELKYQVYENLQKKDSVKMKDLQIFIDINEDQESCLLWYEPKLNLVDKIQNFLGW